MTMVNQKPISIKTIAGAAAVLIAAVGIGLVIRQIRSRPVEQEPVVQAPEDVPQVETPVIRPLRRERENRNVEPPQPPVEEVVVEPEPEVVEPVQAEPAYTPEEQLRNQRTEDARQWMSWLGTLSQEERTQLFRGSIMSFLSLMQRWQYLPPEQAQAEYAQLQQLVLTWQNLPTEDRQQGIQAIQQQLQQWLQSGQQ